jgi:hypothetical protein
MQVCTQDDVVFEVVIVKVLGIVAGIKKHGAQVGEQVAKKYEAQIVIFCILFAVNRFSPISQKIESH